MSLRRTPFFAFHEQAGARLIDFGGWELPVQYEGLIKEHRRVREAAGLFDVSHMGEVRVRGPRALEVVDHLVANTVTDLVDGQARYTPMCNERGGIVDDLIVYRVAQDDFFICVNAANRDKDFTWMRDHNPLPGEVEVVAEHDDWAQLAIQGPRATAILNTLTDLDLDDVKYYHFAHGAVAGVPGCVLARTGYTGEDGFEVFLPAAAASTLWPAVLQAGEEQGLAPIGLGARDTLRLEAKMMLYGADMNDDTTALEAALGWAIDLKKDADFIGKQALLAQKATRPSKRLVGLVVDKRPARAHCAVLHEGQVVGEVTSGTKAPTLGKNIALAYVPRQLARPGTELTIDIRGRNQVSAVVHKGPFYKRAR